MSHRSRSQLVATTTLTAPDSKTGAAIVLYRVYEYLEHRMPRDYNDHKAAQLCDALGDLLIAEARVSSWTMDLGFNGCQPDDSCGDDNSIGGVPCIGDK